MPSSSEVLARIFRTEEQAPATLRGYFLSWGEVNAGELREQVERFLAAATATDGDRDGWVAGPPGGYAEAAGLPQRVERERLLVFLDELAAQLRGRLRGGGSAALLQGWARQVDQCAARVAALRIQPRHALQSLGSALRRSAGTVRGG